MEDAAVPIGGEAFAALAVLFVLGMLAIAITRMLAKSRGRGRSGRRSDGGGSYIGGDAGRDDRSHDTSDSGGGDGGGGDGGGGGD